MTNPAHRTCDDAPSGDERYIALVGPVRRWILGILASEHADGILTAPYIPDVDTDGIVDGADNCWFVANPDQANCDGLPGINNDDEELGVASGMRGDACDPGAGVSRC